MVRHRKIEYRQRLVHIPLWNHVRVPNLLLLLLNIVQANRNLHIIAVSYIVIFVFIMHIDDGALDQNPHRDFGLDPYP
jgi:hypothetical protein